MPYTSYIVLPTVYRSEIEKPITESRSDARHYVGYIYVCTFFFLNFFDPVGLNLNSKYPRINKVQLVREIYFLKSVAVTYLDAIYFYLVNPVTIVTLRSVL